MPSDMKSPQRRRLLRLAVGSALAVGARGALADNATSHVLSFADLPVGHTRTLKVDSYPILVLHRDRHMIEQLKQQTADLADPDSKHSQQPAYARNPWRSRDPAYLVMINRCTLEGCPTSFGGYPSSSGFSCQCCYSQYDAAGRVHKNQPATRNLAIPHYSLDHKRKLIVVERVEKVPLGG